MIRFGTKYFNYLIYDSMDRYFICFITSNRFSNLFNYILVSTSIEIIDEIIIIIRILQIFVNIPYIPIL